MERRWDRALVTGASSGIGAAIARELAGRGVELVVSARSQDRLEALAAELPVPAEILVADLVDPAALDAVAARVLQDDRPVDLVVNNAGYGTGADLLDRPAEHWLEMVQVNVSAVVGLTHAALARYRTAGSPGGVLNVASVAGFAGSAGLGVYSATKSFLITFGNGVDAEARRQGAVVTTLCPGLTHTEFHERAGMTDLALPELVWQSAEDVARAGVDGVTAGRTIVVPGAVNKAAVAGARLVPLWAQRHLAAAVRGRR
jgi:uncharacterized protein